MVSNPALTSITVRLISIPTFLFIVAAFANFPVFQVALIGTLALYAIGLCFWSKLWFIILPGLLPVLDLMPWSGRILVTEFDLFILSSIAISLLFKRVDFTFIKPLGGIKWLLLGLTFSYGISTYIGFSSIQLLSPPPFFTYLTQYNSVRVAKGFFTALLFLPVLAYEKKQGTPIAKLLSIGIITGFALTILSVLWERTVFPGFFDFSNTYRISGLFSGLLLGGEMLDGYLFLAFPFFIVLLLNFNSAWLRFLGFLIFTGGLYCILVTFTRTNYLALFAVLVILLMGTLKIQQKMTKRNIPQFLIFATIALVITINIFKGGYIGQRFSTTRDSFDQRLNHWENALNIGNPGMVPLLFGNGKGSYPYYYFNYDLTGLSMARFWLMHEGEANNLTHFLRFSPSDKDGTLKVIQRFPARQTGAYKVQITLRSPSRKSQKLLVEFCNENILGFLKECPWLGFSTEPDRQNQWQTITNELTSDHLNKQLFSTVTPLGLYLLNRGLTDSLDIGKVEIVAPDGTQLLKNTTFENGFDYWFFSSGNHLAWHAKNLWVSAIFEGGLIELGLISFLLIYLVWHLLKLIGLGNYFALAMLASISGLMIVGLFGSSFDDPRVSWFFFIIVWLALLKPEHPQLLQRKNTSLWRSLLPFIVFLIIASGTVVYAIKKLGYDVEEATTIFLTKVETKLNLTYAQTYQTKLDTHNLYQWRGQGANPLYNPVVSRYIATGKPLAISDNPEETKLSRLIPVSTTQQLLQAISNAEPGDGIELQTGIYSINQKIEIHKEGLLEKPIVVYARELGNVLIEFDTVEGFSVNAPYWTFQNLIIKGGCENHDKCEHAFHIIGKADGTILRNNIIYDFNAAIKGNGTPQPDGTIIYPDNVLIEKNSFSNTSPRNTSNPVTPIDVVGGENWRVKANFISDFIKLQGNKISYAAFLKGYGKQGLFEENLVMCNKNHYLPEHIQIGLSLGGGGTGSQFCFDKKCQYEHDQGVIQNNIIMNCNDVGIYINKSKDTKIINNTLYNTAGIDIRFPESNATVSNNLLTGTLKTRNQARLIENDNQQSIDKKQFAHWFTNADKADFSPLPSASYPIPTSNLQINSDYCAQPSKNPTRIIGAIDADVQEFCKRMLNNTLASLTIQFNEQANELAKQQQKRLQRYTSEEQLKISVNVCQVGCEFQDLGKALNAVKTNGTIFLDAGTYQTCGYIKRSVHIIGSRLQKNSTHLSQTACDGKAALVINAPDVTLEDLEISNIKVNDNNGACLRVEANASNLSINKLYCHDNQAGIIANVNTGKLSIKNSIFEGNGFNNGKTSNLSINSTGEVELVNSRILSTKGKGHALQVNAHHLLVDNTEISGLNEQNSRTIDNSIGGEIIITNSTLQQSPNSDNDELIGFALGDPKTLLETQIVTMENNRIISDKKANLLTRILNKRKLFKAPDSAEIFLNNNTIIGMDSFGAGNINESGNKQFANRIEAGLDPK